MKKTILFLPFFAVMMCSLNARRNVFRPKRALPKNEHTHDLPVKRLADRRGYVRPSNSSKKSIVVFSSPGGGSHISVSNGLCTYLGDRYSITVMNALKTIYSPVDTMGTLTFGKVCGEDLYNFFLRCGWTNLLGYYAQAGKKYMTWRHNTLVKLTMNYFKDSKPDLVISVMPYINGALLEACRKLDIPFLIIPGDLDTTHYVIGMSGPYPEKFCYTLGYDDPALWEKIAPAGIPQHQVKVTGFPLRPDFFEPKNVPKIKKKFDIPTDKPVVMVLMGGAGSQASYRYVRTLMRLNIPMHIIVCLGRNERLKRNIKKIMLPDGITMSILGFTNQIANLMAVSDVLITKPGPGSVCEGVASLAPMILDMTHGTLYWEQLNIDLMVKYGFAEPLFDYSCLEKMLLRYFNDKAYTASLKKSMAEFTCRRFDKTIGKLVDDFLASPKK